MLINLIKYDYMKKWRHTRFFLIAYIVIEALLLFYINTLPLGKIASSAFSVSNSGDTSFSLDPGNINYGYVMAAGIFFLVVGIFSLYSIVEGIIVYNWDLSGKQSPLELMLPYPGWKKVLSKLISTGFNILVFGILTTIFTLLFVHQLGDKTAIFDPSVNLLKLLYEKSPSPLGSSFISLLLTLINSSLTFLYICFCITVSRAINNKNKASVLISILIFIVGLIVKHYLNLFTVMFPIYQFDILGKINTLSYLLLNIASLIVVFFSASWLIDNKIES
ncbi:hypothetical protein [Clostridium manihotivorum]|uniref:Uncharacterized protein n=1 Tax=Clostridium manihotivorum TaxID=2320868 RepID=A0A3R5UA85_9CLOT|nr:hypothetical protein [Clostridium manihotivorum]QAA33405.1 hypothetical protein C1I91_18115 [Clostridium manihotivorum]